MSSLSPLHTRHRREQQVGILESYSSESYQGQSATTPDKSSFPQASLLPNCQHYLMFIEPGRTGPNDTQVGPADLQRQARVIINPQYKQDNEQDNLDKANYNQSPLQIFSTAGQDNTTWRGLYVNINVSPNTSGTTQTLFIPFAVKYTIEFSGRRWLPALPNAEYRLHSRHLLGTNKLGSGPHLGEGAIKPYYDGPIGCKHTEFTESHVQEQRGTTPALDNKDEQTDSEEPISTSYTSNMSGGSRNKY